MRVGIVALFLALIFSGTMASAASRVDHWSGFDLTAGQPFPSFGGVMVGFNLGEDARVSAGGGWFGRFYTATIDAKFFLSGSDFAPYIGGGVSYLTGSAGRVLFWDLNFNQAYTPYVQTGLDWTAPTEGPAIHLGVNVALSSTSRQILCLPGIAIGMYF